MLNTKGVERSFSILIENGNSDISIKVTQTESQGTNVKNVLNHTLKFTVEYYVLCVF